MFYRRNKETNSFIKFHSLAPTENAEKTDIYFSALDWAIKEKNIKNIAITGNYGSGKSSILNTYQKNSKHKKRFLNISLATFDKKDYKTDENVIEKSILQQLFYKEKIKKTPFSRFKKINNLNDKLWLKLIIMILIIFSIIWFINPNLFYSAKDWIIDKFNYNFIVFNNRIDTILNFLIKSIILILSVSVIVYLLNVIYKVIINISYKFTIKKYDMELEITPKDKQTKESIFNKYIDEIIYFFEITDYDIVIFEDLDRIKNYAGLFIKLRELNTLLNNSKIIKKDKITFIYAVKDDVFSDDKERTKFFEFIIPVIPIINSNNSKDKLLDIIKDMPYMKELSDSKFLNNITLYIDDMRLLNSIINEFNIYSRQIDIHFDVKKLFSIIIYKNLFPKDFSELQCSKGILFNIINRKQENLLNIITELNETKQNLEEELENLKNNKGLYSIEYYKRIIWTYLEQKYGYGNAFYINDIQYSSINTFITNNEINSTDALKTLKVGRNSSNIKVSDIIDNIDENIQYTKNELDTIITQKTEQLSTISDEIIKIKSKKVSEIIQKYGIREYYNLPDNMGILSYLLKNGFIDESYRDYINYFYPTTLSIEDKNFILNFNNQIKTEYNYKLHKINNVIDYFNIDDYLREEILNFDLLEYMLKNAHSYNIQLNNIFQQLNNHVYGLEFIKEYIINRKITPSFIEYFVKHCSTIWDQLMKLLTNNYKRRLLHRVLLYADIQDIEKYLATNENFIMQVEKCKYFCRLFNEDTIERANSILKLLKIKFINIDKKTIHSDLFDIIYKGNHYEINLKNVELILIEKLKANMNNVRTNNYSTISEYKELSDYINENIQKYITEVFLKYKDNTLEEIKYINKLLNFESLDIDLKRKIIIKELTIADLNSITEKVLTQEDDEKETSLWGLYLETNKVIPSFANIILYYDKYSLNDTLITFINNNFDNLEKNITLNLKPYESFIKDIIKNDKINDNCFAHITSLASIKYTFSDFDFSNINKVRSKQILTNSNIEIKFNKQNYDNISENHNELLSTFIENNIKEFCNSMNELNYDIDLIISIIESTNIDRSYKTIIISNCNEDIEFTNISQKEKIIDFILKGRKPFDINYNLFKMLVDSKLDASKLIALIIFQESKLDNEQLCDCLLNFDEPYCNIPKYSKIPKLLINNMNSKFKKLIEQRDLKYISKITKTKDNKYYQINKKQQAS